MNAPVGALPLLPTHKDRRGWLIAFGVVEILMACFFLLMAAVMAALIPNIPRPAGQPAVPSGFFLAIGVFYGLLGGVFAAAGVGSIQAKNWARILMIVLSSLWLGFGVLGTLGCIAILPVMVRQEGAILQQNPAAQAGQLPPHFMTLMMIIMIVFQIFIMVLLPLVFLLFYTRKNVKATCEWLSAAALPPALPTNLPTAPSSVTLPLIPGSSAAAPVKTGFPVPVILAVIWFSFIALSGLLTALMFPLTMVFGVKIQGMEARLIALALAGVNGYCAWGFYKLKIATWWTSLVVFAFSFVSGILAVIRGTTANLYEDVYRQMGIDPQQVRPFMLDAQTMRYLQSLGLLVFLALLGLILYSRRYFDARLPES